MRISVFVLSACPGPGVNPYLWLVARRLGGTLAGLILIRAPSRPARGPAMPPAAGPA